jgi:hypothetical protein
VEWREDLADLNLFDCLRADYSHRNLSRAGDGQQGIDMNAADSIDRNGCE